MDCPHDGNLMEIDDTGRQRRYSCPVCRGMFVPEREVTTGLGYKEPKTIAQVAGVKVESMADAKIRCPKDGARLKLVTLLNTEIDACPSCKGLWFEWGEYEKLFNRMERKHREEAPQPAKLRPTNWKEVEAPVTTDDVLDFVRGAFRWARFWSRIL